MSTLGPCVVCGKSGYALSFGGPTICPSCDCGIAPGEAKLKLENANLRRQLTELTMKLEAATPPTAAGASADTNWKAMYEHAIVLIDAAAADGDGMAGVAFSAQVPLLNLSDMTPAQLADLMCRDATSSPPPSPAQTGEERACPCGLATCVEQWEPGCGLGTREEFARRVPEDDATVRDAARYRYIRDFPPRARARKDGNTKPSLNDMWVAAFLRPQTEAILQMDILEGELLDARVDAAIAAAESGE